MKKRKLLRSLLCGIVLLGSIGGFVSSAYADSTNFEFTLSNVAGVSSGVSYTENVIKEDTNQKFYIKLTMMTQTPRVYFTACNSAYEMVANPLTIESTQLLSKKEKEYDIMTALQGASYYVDASIPRGYSNVYITGTYWP